MEPCEHRLNSKDLLVHTEFLRRTGNILTLQKLLGYSSVAVTMKYAHLAPDFMSDEIARLRFKRPAATVTDLAGCRVHITRNLACAACGEPEDDSLMARG